MSYSVAVTRELRAPDGSSLIDLGLDELTDAGVKWHFLAPHERLLHPGDIQDIDALIVWEAAIDASTLKDIQRLSLVARLGVGLDDIDVAACSDAGVLVTITPDAVRRPVASAAVAFMLALSHRVVPLDRIVRAGHWYNQVRDAGPALSGRTVGVIGLGNIGKEIFRLLAPWEMRGVAFDPYPPRDLPNGVELLSLDEVLAAADFIVIACPLTAETYHLIDHDRLSRAKTGAHLVNIARGPIVDTDALVEALADGRLAGAALDVLEDEPPPKDHPLLGLNNVVLAPHAIAATDDFNLAVGRSAIASVLAFSRGQLPTHVVNAAAAKHPRIRRRFASRGVGIRHG